MSNEKKKDYREIAENNMIPRNTLIKDVYVKLEQTPETDIQARVTEIREALEEVNTRTAKMQRKMMAKTRKQQKEDKEGNKALEEISLTGRRLENEAEMLDSFPRVRATITAISEAEWKAGRELMQKELATREAQNALEEAKKAEVAVLEAEAKVHEIDIQIAEIKADMEEAKAKGRKQKIIDAYQEEIDEKTAEKKALGSPEDWKKTMEEVQIAEERVNVAKKEEQEQGRLLAVLQNPWDTLLKGYLWSEISDLTSEDLSKLSGAKIVKEEAKWSETPKKSDKTEEGKKEEDKKDKNESKPARVEEPIARQVPLQPIEEQEPKQEDEMEEEPEGTQEEQDGQEQEEEQEEEQEQEETNLPTKWSERHKVIAKILPSLAKWMDEAKVKEDVFTEKFRRENSREPSWFQKLKARFSKKQIEYAEPERTPEDLAKAREIITKNHIAKELAKQRQEEIREKFKQEDEQIAAITQELHKMTSEEIRETAPLWEGLLSEAAIERAYNTAVLRERPKSEKAKQYEEEIAGSSRKAHRDFAKRINEEATQTDTVEHVEAELVTEGPLASKAKEERMEDPFEEEK